MIAPATYISTSEQLRSLAKALAKEPLLALDTESNSLYAYREQVCLVQISTRSADYIVDPLSIDDMSPLASLMVNPAIEKVFHAAEYDLMTMKRDFGYTVVNLFDTMVAARICGYKNIGLGNLLDGLLGIKLDKSHQRDDWGQRPLPKDSLVYAQMDTHYLPALRDLLSEKLTQVNRWREAHETFEDLADVQPSISRFDPEGYWRIALPNQLTRRQIAILRELYLMRERMAEGRNLPPFKIMSDKLLMALATAAPRHRRDLDGVEGLTPANIRRYGDDVLAAVARGIDSKLPQPPPPEPPADPSIVERYTALREWRKNRATERGVESDVIISKDTLWTLAEKLPRSLDEMRDIRGLGPWRLETYGGELLDILKRYK
jgi:ribonuclease D